MYIAEPGRTDWDMRQSCCAKAVLDILYSTSIYSTLYCTVALNWSWVCGSAEAQLPDGGFHRYFPLKYWIYSVKYFGNFWVRGSRLESGISPKRFWGASGFMVKYCVHMSGWKVILYPAQFRTHVKFIPRLHWHRRNWCAAYQSSVTHSKLVFVANQ